MHLCVTQLNLRLLFCAWLGLPVLLVGLLLSSHLLATAAATALPPIQFDPTTNTLFIGRNSSDQPASESIDLPQLAALLTAQGQGALLVAQADQSWLLTANVVLERSARLNITAATASWLKLESPPAAPVVVTARRGGHLYLEGVKVTSWNSSAQAVDTTLADGRSYLLALEGGRLDILQSDVSYLGTGSGEPSGLSWRKRLNSSDPTTGATGRVEDSQIHNNYFGIYTRLAHR